MGTPERIQNVEKDIASKKHIRLQNNRKKIAVFIDRDGVINEERGLITKPDQFYLIDGVSEAIKKINDAGIITVLVTNQPIISRGDASRSELKIIHNKMETILGREGAYLDAIYYPFLSKHYFHTGIVNNCNSHICLIVSNLFIE